jgi:predicted cupin superfamily sugar epimerase
MSGLSDATRALIERLGLEPHPEGGFYRETWRSPVVLPASALPPGYPGPRAVMTSIYFLLPTGVESALHRVRSEELWMHHEGDPVELGIGPTPEAASDPTRRRRLGPGPEASHQIVVPAGEWQTARALPGPVGHALVGCVVAPGFDFEDFELLD